MLNLNFLYRQIFWVLLFTIMFSFWLLIAKFLGFYSEKIELLPLFQKFYIIPALALFYLALRDIKTRFYSQDFKYIDGFKVLIILTLFIIPSSTLSIYSNVVYFSPELIPNAIGYSMNELSVNRLDAELNNNLESYLIQSYKFNAYIGLFSAILLPALFKLKK